jgi:uncharacterized protein YdbL (DUF1318 family)
MKTRMMPALGLFLFTCLFLGAGAAFADEAAIKAGMKERLPKVLAAKDAGTIGEGADGLLHGVGELAPDGAKLLAAENADRKAYFALKAKQAGGTVDAVAKAMAKGFLARGKPGHWFRDANGKWRKK